jgi:ribosomal protein L22
MDQLEEFRKADKQVKKEKQATLVPGSLSDNSIFGADTTSTADNEADPAAAKAQFSRDPAIARYSTDPNPSARERWQRKMVIRSIHKRGRLTKAQVLARTEREHLHKSEFFPTSVKKLMLVARQIAGKNVDDALIQLRFSKKKIAKDVMKHLEYARDNAIVSKGMGLGGVSSSSVDDKNTELTKVEEKTVDLVEKNGKVRKVKPTSIYIDQAWVGRGEYFNMLLPRARGRADVLRRPHTSEFYSSPHLFSSFFFF